MLYVAVTNDPSGELFAQIYNVLAKLVNVVKIEKNQLAAQNIYADVLLYHTQDISNFAVPNPIIIVASDSFKPLFIPYNATVITELGLGGGIYANDEVKLTVIDCGLSPKATITFSSMGQENLVVSLQRNIMDITGGSIDPREIPIDVNFGTGFPALAACGVFLIGGFISHEAFAKQI